MSVKRHFLCAVLANRVDKKSKKMIFLQKNSFAILLVQIYEYIFASEKRKDMENRPES